MKGFEIPFREEGDVMAGGRYIIDAEGLLAEQQFAISFQQAGDAAGHHAMQRYQGPVGIRIKPHRAADKELLLLDGPVLAGDLLAQHAAEGPAGECDVGAGQPVLLIGSGYFSGNVAVALHFAGNKELHSSQV